MKKNQAGFGVVEGLLVLVVAGIIGFTGWYVLQSKSKTNNALDNAANSQANPDKKTAAPVATQAQSEVKYLEVPEYGVRFKLSHDIADAYYQVNPEPTAGISLRVHSLDSEPECKTGRTSVAGLIKVAKDEVNPLADNKKYSEVMKGAIIGDYFYYIGNAQYSCVQDPNNQALLEKVRAAFAEASSTIEKL